MNCPVCEQENPDDASYCSGCGASLDDGSADVQRMIGETIGGRYLVKRVIGEGGMGVVYEAEQRMGPAVRTVAVKTLLPWMGRDPAIRSRFYREGGTVSQLEHPNTVRVYDFGETPDGRLYIAMEYIRGEQLTDAIARGPMPPERVRHILRQVAGALEEAHAQGIIHRDLKPDNIVLTRRADEEDFVKVLDFGIAARTGPAAKRQTKLTKQGMVLGTPPYMSPEQLAGEELDRRSDVYSLGVIAYEMLTGKLPFEADTPWQWAHKHMTEAPAPPTTVTDRPIPAEMEHAVMQALAKRPADRPASARDFFRLLCGEAPVAQTQPEYETGRTTPMPVPPEIALHERTELGGGQPAFRTGAAVAAPIPPPPSARRRRRSWAGWALAVTGIAALAAVTIGIATLQKPGGGEPGAGVDGAATGAAGSSGQTEIAPLIEPPPETPPAAPPDEPEPSRRTTPPKPKKPAEPPPLPAPPPAQPPPAQPPPAQPPPAQPPPALPPATQPPRLKLPQTPSAAQGDALCKQSEEASKSGNIEGAVALYRSCASSGGSESAKANARARVRAHAPGVVKKRAFLGDCAGARSAANAAASIGEGAAAQAALAQTSCR